ncbi:hypothetical protein LAZ67_15000322 [Cordylochernes scorpioides]|uniref:Histone-lysine N-methyltransferase SETMAR n=1 Tax=Cordylochernes scorpioides TaxID=51811 RepID=A0ABY6L7Z2_9ARAC|nr:hypothetical protein LAZ67_15000322 [Cordylochernes scorpioides]
MEGPIFRTSLHWWNTALLTRYLPDGSQRVAHFTYQELCYTPQKFEVANAIAAPRMGPIIAKKRPDRQGQIILLHDNARPHVAQVVKVELQELEWEVLQHPPYSPDLAPTDYYLFRYMSNHMRGTNFDDEEDLKPWLNNFFDTRPSDFWVTWNGYVHGKIPILFSTLVFSIENFHTLPIGWNNYVEYLIYGELLSGQVDEVAGVTHLKTKMVLVDGSLRYTGQLHSLGMEADAEEPGLQIQGHFAGGEERERESSVNLANN